MKQVNEAKKDQTSRFPEHEQLLLVTLKLSDGEMGTEEDGEYVDNLEEKLVEKVETLDYAFWDGHEYGGGYAKIFLYTSDVDKLYKALYKTFKNINFTAGSCIVLQYSQSPMEHFVIDPNKLPD